MTNSEDQALLSQYEGENKTYWLVRANYKNHYEPKTDYRPRVANIMWKLGGTKHE